MKRFFLVADADMPAPGDTLGHWHAIHLGTHGPAGHGHNVVALFDDHVPPKANWKPMPSLRDARTRLKARVHHPHLADIGLTGEETMLQTAERLGEIHPMLGL